MDLFQGTERSGYQSEAGDRAVARELAGRYVVRGTAKLRLSRRAGAELSSLLDAAARLRRGDGGAALALLDGQAPVIEACARQARAEGGARLPAWAGAPRLQVYLAALCASDTPLTEARLLDALMALDELQPLTDAELWSAPAALRVAIAGALTRAASAIVERARQRSMAERWVNRSAGGLRRRGDAFLARALKQAEALGRPAARRRLDAELARRALSAGTVVARDQAGEAAALLRLENLLAARRVADALNWQACFRRLSRVEQTLGREAAGTYPGMDDASRAAVRREVARIAEKLGLPEHSVARAAVDAARAGDGLQGEVCWWLYDDAGRRALIERLGRPGVRLGRRVPDPTGRGTVAVILSLAAALAALLCRGAGTPWLWPACAVLGWGAADLLAGRFYTRLCPPSRLLKLKMDRVPEDCRTLVTMPVLLSSPRRAEDICAQLEALGCLEASDNIEYLLLGDLADAPEREMPGDGAILDRARACVDAMNARAGRQKYALLVRERTLLAADGMWMGKDRKRGALMAVNRLLLGGDASPFGAEGGDCERLKGRFKYVITLDADTRALPEDLRRLIGAMAHPLNRRRPDGGYAVLQPRMEALPSACANGFERLFAGAGGVSAYPVCVSNLWQDLTGRGIFGGKGIYDVAAFQERVGGALPEGRILSHDLAEGALAGAGFVGDVAFYDAHPSTLAATLRRRHRWTRGDWQLLPVLLSRKNGLGAADRFRMADNLMRSLWDPALLALLLGAAWTGGEGALAAALALSWLEPVLGLGNGDDLKWRRATARLALAPLSAFNALDAILRTLWRLGVSGKHLMQWVTAADAEERADRIPRWPGRGAALLLASGALGGHMPGALLALAALLWIGPGWVAGMESEPIGAVEPLSADDRAFLMDLARRTWRFFADNMPPEGSPLPPDNVQLDPPVGAARRTSPTNIALYLLSCLSARRLGLVGVAEARQRLADAVDALERLEKWRGQLYNWYDIDTLAPLRPRYVSSVDSGNLAAALLLCANAPEVGGDLARRMRALAGGMDLAALYDGDRELFAIGVDVETGRVSEGRYDLLASEARILSYTAMLLGQVPPSHWGRLGRACAKVGGGVAPLSWSGTMFEFLLPQLFLNAPPLTLLGEGVGAAVAAQIERGRRLNRPWGVSESGYCALDAGMNYQYRAFGLPALALDGEAAEGVVAPYASALAALVAPRQAVANLRRMARLGWMGEWGFYEAADYLRPEKGTSDDGPDISPCLVMSHMAHHQGMALCAVCEALTGHSLRADFMAQPRARALSLLLEERPCAAATRRPIRRVGRPARTSRGPAARRGEPNAVEAHLLHGGGLTALCTDDGATHLWRGDFAVTRFSGSLRERRDMARVWLVDGADGHRAPLVGPGVYAPGSARYHARVNRLSAAMEVCLSPEDGTLLKAVSVTNTGATAVECAVADVVPLALCGAADWRAHAVYRNLFVQGETLSPGGLLFSRRSDGGDDGPRLAMLASGGGGLTWECDYEKLAGRYGDVGATDALVRPLSGGTSATLNPAGALRVALKLAPGETARVCFAMGLLEDGTSPRAWSERWRQPGNIRRSFRLAGIRAGALLDFLGLDAGEHHRLQRMAALLVDGGLAAAVRGFRRDEAGVSRAALWSLGLSGERPILAMGCADARDVGAARALIRAHGFYRAMGLETDLALIDEGVAGYHRPVRDGLESLVASSHLNRTRRVPGGVWLLDGGALDGEQRRALARFASATFSAASDFDAQVRSLLRRTSGPSAAVAPLDLGESRLKPLSRLADNGFGGFAEDGAYVIDVLPDRLPPAPWCNILANDAGGMLLSERGGGFFWRGNSRSGRLTPYGNDSLREGWGLSLELVDDAGGGALSLLPGERPATAFRVTHSPVDTRYLLDNDRVRAGVRLWMDSDRPEARIEVTVENRRLKGGRFRLSAAVDWLMGTDALDVVALNRWGGDGACLATGVMDGVGWLAASDPLARGDGAVLDVPLSLKRGETRILSLALGWAGDVDAALRRVRLWRAEDAPPPEELPLGLTLKTPDGLLNAFANGFLLHQVRASRVQGRTGLYQPGGAWGFRDQLQDMLALVHHEPDRVRAHLLRCAAHQFEAGDVMHWWHEPFTGVRTRISDDLLFLPWVTAAYVETTGDAGVLLEPVAYLKEAAIPEGAADVYREMTPGTAVESLHGHCMRAFRRAFRVGGHGLMLMGTGDWNDGMNRVGAAGRGESVWLTQFAIACAERYRRVAPAEADRVWLWRMGETLRQAVEAHGWDGGWYLRAWDDDGMPLGGAKGRECRIDAIAQAWAVLAGLDAERCRMAMDAAWTRLMDGDAGIIRLLTPPFDGLGPDPGYIRAYPPGVRENGGQYTHGALWLLLALIRQGDGVRAHRALQMLLPYNHADGPEKAMTYRVEPYVMAADVYDRPGMRGRGGWTWYTGSAGWMYSAILALLGYERRGDAVRLNALLGDWPAVAVTVPFGHSRYRLTCDRQTRRATLDGRAVEGDFIRMTDDGKEHEARFPGRILDKF
ncbi:MAG: hypothetical protein IKE17_02430 [Clostridia bacterium]|nr:hypothetical protein [Clostridia bacterium]